MKPYAARAVLLAMIVIASDAPSSGDHIDEAIRNPAGAKPAFEALFHGRTKEAIALLESNPEWIWAENGGRRSLLNVAVSEGNIEVIRWLLEHGANVNGLSGYTPLHEANTPEVVAILLKHKPDLTAVALSMTPLQKIVDPLNNPRRRDEHKRRREMAKMLLDAGAEYDLFTAIHLADLARVKAILSESPALLNQGQGGRQSPLRLAAAMGHLAICKYLVCEAHADVNDIENGSGYPVLLSAVAHPAIVKLLIENGADVRARITWQGGRTGWWPIGDDATPLHFAAEDGVPETITLLLDHGAYAFARSVDEYEESEDKVALEVACLFVKPDNAKAILMHKSFEAIKGARRQQLLDRCLLLACDCSIDSIYGDAFGPARSALLKLLLAQGANPNAANDGPTAASRLAASISGGGEEDRDYTDQINLLIAHGATIDLCTAIKIGDDEMIQQLLADNPGVARTKDSQGDPAIHQAVAMNNEKAVKALLAANCPVDFRDDSNGTALHAATLRDADEIAQLLIAAGADVNARNKHGSTPLHYAVFYGSLAVAKRLLDQGANIDAKDAKGRTPGEDYSPCGCAVKKEAMKRLLDEYRGTSVK